MNGDPEELQLRFGLAISSNRDAYRITVDMPEIGLHIEVIDVQLKAAIIHAVDNCVARLTELRYQVTAGQMMFCLEAALDKTQRAGVLKSAIALQKQIPKTELN